MRFEGLTGLVNRIIAWADRTQRKHGVLGFPYAVVKKYGDDQGGREAALITYYGFLSIFPLLLLGVAVLSRVLIDHPDLRRRLIDAIVPKALRSTVEHSLTTLPTSTIPFILGLIGLLLSGTGVVFSVYQTLNNVAAVPYRLRAGFVSRYVRVFVMLATLLIGAVAVGALTVVATALPGQPGVQRAAAVLGSALVIFGVLLLGAKLLLARPAPVRALWPGALLGAVVVTVVLNVGAPLLARLVTKAGPVYGSFATVAGLFGLLYLVGQGLVYAAEVAAVRYARLWPRALDLNRPTAADTRALALLAREQERIPAARVEFHLAARGSPPVPDGSPPAGDAEGLRGPVPPPAHLGPSAPRRARTRCRALPPIWEARGMTSHVVIVGGGIAGLAAAFFLRDEPVRVTVLEGSPRLGGKLAVSEVAGIAVDEGAEALLTRRPEGTGLIAAAGLGDELSPAGPTSSAIWTRGALRPLPGRQFMGVPSDMDELARSGVLSVDGVARAREDRALPSSGHDRDVSVAEYVGARLGHEVVDRLVDPLLGGVYAGRSGELSFEATLSPLAIASHRYASLAEAAASLLPPAQPAGSATTQAGAASAPLFTALTGGLGALPGVLAKASGATVRTGAMVRELARTEQGWRLTVGPAADAEMIDADAVILAVPGRPAGRLLAGVPGAVRAAAELAAIPYASMAIVTLAYPRSAFPGPAEEGETRAAPGEGAGEAVPEDRAQGNAPGERGALAAQGRSGYLVPAVDGRAVKAVTFSTVKWPHLARAAERAADAPGGGRDALEIVRCSVGRIGEEALLHRDDADLVALAAAELAEATGVDGGPVASRVTRWGGALPQYTVGHLDRVARIRAAVAAEPGLAICGAAYDGVGIPACVATARTAVDEVLGHLLAISGTEQP